MKTHTPGPWGLYGSETPTVDHRLLESSAGLSIGSVHHTEPIARVSGFQHDVEANAALIAAAPDLLAALQKALRDSGCDGDLCNWAWHEQARAAIAAATGNA